MNLNVPQLYIKGFRLNLYFKYNFFITIRTLNQMIPQSPLPASKYKRI